MFCAVIKLDNKRFSVSFICSVYWSSDTIVGYFSGLFTQLACGMIYLFVVFSQLQFFMGFHSYLECFCADVQMLFDEIDDGFVGARQSNKAIEIAQRQMNGVVKFHIEIIR